MLMSPHAAEVAQVTVEERWQQSPQEPVTRKKYMTAWKASQVKVIPVVGLALARRMERCGADAVIAEGMESGGHIGSQTTMTLVPQVVDADPASRLLPQAASATEEVLRRP